MPIYTCYNSWHRFTFTIYSFIEIIINLKFVETSLPGYPLTIYTILKLVLQLRPFCSWAKLGGTKFSNFAILHSKKGIEIIFFFFQFEGKRFEGIVKSVHSLSRHFSPPKLELGTMLGERGTDVENYLRQERRGEGSDLAGL